MATIKLGELLIKAKVLDEAQLKSALAEQKRWGGRLGEILVRMEIISEEMLVKALAKQLGLQAVNLDAVQTIAPNVRAKVPLKLARDLDMVPLQLGSNNVLVVAMAEPQNLKHLDTIRSRTGCRPAPQVAGHSQIARAIARFYQVDEEDLVQGDEPSFKLVDAQGRTLSKSVEEMEAEDARIRQQKAAMSTPAQVSPSTTHPSGSYPAVRPSTSTPSQSGAPRSPGDVLNAVEEAQRKEVAALKAMVELLIEKGVFSRDEYLARLKR